MRGIAVRSWFGSVMDIINRVMLVSIVLTGTVLIRKREQGTIEHLLVMPVTPMRLWGATILCTHPITWAQEHACRLRLDGRERADTALVAD